MGCVSAIRNGLSKQLVQHLLLALSNAVLQAANRDAWQNLSFECCAQSSTEQLKCRIVNMAKVHAVVLWIER